MHSLYACVLFACLNAVRVLSLVCCFIWSGSFVPSFVCLLVRSLVCSFVHSFAVEFSNVWLNLYARTHAHTNTYARTQHIHARAPASYSSKYSWVDAFRLCVVSSCCCWFTFQALNRHTEANSTHSLSETKLNENRSRQQQSQNEHSIDHVTHWNTIRWYSWRCDYFISLFPRREISSLTPLSFSVLL